MIFDYDYEHRFAEHEHEHEKKSDLQHLCHDLLHHLVRTAADGGEARIDKRATGGVLVHVPRAAPELHAGGGDELVHRRAEHFGHRDVERRVDVAHHLADAAV